MFLPALAVTVASFFAPIRNIAADLAPKAPPMCALDTAPSELSDSTKWVSGEPHYAGTILRDILVLVFRRGTPQSDRQSAIERVKGSIVGASAFAKDECVYLVRVPTDGTIEPLFRAIATLRALPQVSIAMPEEIIFFTPDARARTDSIERRRPTGRSSVPLIPPGKTPRALFDSLGTVTASTPGIDPGPYRRDIVIVKFMPGTPLTARQAAIDSVAGEVVGGYQNPDGQDGTYYVQISGGTFGALSQAVLTLMRQPQVGFASWWQMR